MTIERLDSIIGRYVRMCYERHPPTIEDLNGLTVEESIRGDIKAFMSSTFDTYAILYFMIEYDHNHEILDYVERIRFHLIPERYQRRVTLFHKTLTQS